MTLEEKIQTDLITAMKAKDEVTLRSVRAIKAAIIMVKTDGSGQTFDADKEIKLLQKMVKQRKESLAIFEQQGRTELAKIESDEIAVIEKYLPQKLSIEAVEEIVKKIIADTGAVGMKEMGKVIGAANKQLAGQAESAVISGIVKKLLT